MLIVSGVNIFPSDIEYVVRGLPGLTGEYRITVYTEHRLLRFDVDVETIEGYEAEGERLATLVIEQIKQRSGVQPKRVNVLPNGTLPRATHKAKRIVDLRDAEDLAKGAGI
jgi:phenylacetate-CoA ligase